MGARKPSAARHMTHMPAFGKPQARHGKPSYASMHAHSKPTAHRSKAGRVFAGLGQALVRAVSSAPSAATAPRIFPSLKPGALTAAQVATQNALWTIVTTVDRSIRGGAFSAALPGDLGRSVAALRAQAPWLFGATMSAPEAMREYSTLTLMIGTGISANVWSDYLTLLATAAGLAHARAFGAASSSVPASRPTPAMGPGPSSASGIGFYYSDLDLYS